MTLRPYQVTLRDEMRLAYRQGSKRVLAVSPTGSGKTCLFALTVKSAAERGSRCTIVVHRAEIIEQISRTLTAVGVKHGFIQAGKSRLEAPVMVASVQTLARRLQEVTPPDFVVVDECHHSVSAQYISMFAAWPNARFLGVTATPERLDGRGLGEVFDRMVLGPSSQWLIDNGFLARPVYYAPKQAIDLSGVRKLAGDFHKGDLDELMAKPTIIGDAISHYRKLANGLPAVAFCVSVAHAEAIAEAFNRFGIPAASIDGSMSPETRKDRVNGLASGAIRVLTSCELISEGFDLPSVGAAILLRPTQSLALHLQQIGRALRPKAPGNAGQAIILDHVSNCLRLGLAEDHREWDLAGRAKRKSREKPPETKQCESCFAIFSGRSCPQCGTERKVVEREIEVADGELVKLDREAAYIRRREEGSCQTLQDFQKLAAARGYARGWAYHRWKARQGRRPAAPVPEPMLIH